MKNLLLFALCLTLSLSASAQTSKEIIEKLWNLEDQYGNSFNKKRSSA